MQPELDDTVLRDLEMLQSLMSLEPVIAEVSHQIEERVRAVLRDTLPYQWDAETPLLAGLQQNMDAETKLVLESVNTDTGVGD